MDKYRSGGPPAALRLILDALEKAEKTLRLAGYTDEGGELWKPPLGPSATPLLDALEEREAQVAHLKATLAESCALYAKEQT